MKQATLPIFPTPNIDLFCGDCLEVMKDIPDGSIDMIMADPPYGTTACKWDSIIPLEPMWKQLKRVIKKNGSIVLTASQPFTTTLISSNRDMFKYCWVWYKNKSGNCFLYKISPMRRTEDILVFINGSLTPQNVTNLTFNHDAKKSKILMKTVMKKEGVQNSGTRDDDKYKKYYGNTGYADNVLRYDVDNPRLHPTQKPVALMEYLIKTYTNEGETVLDFCMGSGTTGVACKNLNRDFIGIEKDPGYFEIAENRIQPSLAFGGSL